MNVLQYLPSRPSTSYPLVTKHSKLTVRRLKSVNRVDSEEEEVAVVNARAEKEERTNARKQKIKATRFVFFGHVRLPQPESQREHGYECVAMPVEHTLPTSWYQLEPSTAKPDQLNAREVPQPKAWQTTLEIRLLPNRAWTRVRLLLLREGGGFGWQFEPTTLRAKEPELQVEQPTYSGLGLDGQDQLELDVVGTLVS